ncbi:MAG: NAD(P)/FAD-dependent oxidoreductase [Candidatus Eisenbacteria bacterium]|nr:NAD(P)/FAD-dependent oxidoreductase [Candidatus Eisenbacteria bacterium]
MARDYDILTIGLGPAGMAVSVMGSAMGLKVCAVEKHKIGGECMNVGCIPSKALLRMAKTRAFTEKLEEMELEGLPSPGIKHPFERIQEKITYINEKKTRRMFDKVDLILGEGEASFVDGRTVEAAGRRITAKNFFVCAGTKPMMLPIPGVGDVDVLTNENIFHLDTIPKSMIIIGGGAIGCEMAQAFQRLGCGVRIVQIDPYLLPFGDPEAGHLLEKVFREDGIEVYNGRHISRIARSDGGVVLETEEGDRLVADRLLMAAGRKPALESLRLDRAGVATTKRGITVNRHVRTNRRDIYAPGDCNGTYLLSHAAMHQGMAALMNCMIPPPFRMNFRKYVVPWTVFTEPQVSFVGEHERALKNRGAKYEVTEMKYEDYGAAIAEGVGVGWVRILASPAGRIYGVGVVGEGSGDMINQWGLAIQKKIRLHEVMLLQHSFPTMGYLNKMAAEQWMMGKMKSPRLQRMAKWMYRM